MRIRNEQARSWTIKITDRPYSVETTSPGTPADQLPPMGVLTVNVWEDEEVVLQHDTITLRKEAAS